MRVNVAHVAGQGADIESATGSKTGHLTAIEATSPESDCVRT